MLRLLFILIPSLLVACSGDKPAPIASAGKAISAAQKPEPPTNLRFDDPTSTSCRVRWDASEGATDYDVAYKDSSATGHWQSERHVGTRLNNLIQELNPKTTYRWMVRAANRSGRSLWQEGPTFTTLPDSTVFIPDTALRTSIEQALGKSPGDMIIQDEMKTLSVLSIKNLGIKDLKGLETARNLTWVNIDSNRVSDLTPLSDLTNLEFLAFGDNRVSDITPLSNLTNLESLYLFSNQVSDISLLSALTNLGVLNFSDNEVSDIGSLSSLTNLQSLSFSINEVSDITSLSSLTNLQSLSFSDNEVSDISSLSNLTNLVSLGFSINEVSDISSLSSLTNLQSLSFNINEVSDISSLSALTNLQLLSFEYNRVSDLTPLSNLTNLILLYFFINQVSDLTPLSDLTNLQHLDFGDNEVSDISSLSNLTNLQYLGFSINQVADLTPLTNMSNLQEISFSQNSVSDLSPLAALLSLEKLDALNNPLSKVSIDVHIPAFQRRGVDVYFSPSLPFTETESPFNIDLVFLGDFAEEEREIWYHAANRWEAAIQTELPDYTFPDTWSWSVTCGDQPINILGGEQIDDLRIYVTKANEGYRNYGTPLALHSNSLPLIGCIQVSPLISYSFQRIEEVGLHEIGHVLGIGTIWHDSEMLRDLDGDTHFAGPQAIAAFDQAGGTDYQGAKVPIERDGLHWRSSVLSGELMTLIRRAGDDALSAITLQALSDLGYSVDLSAADPYVLPSPTAAKPVADAELEFFCSLEGLPAPVYVDD